MNSVLNRPPLVVSWENSQAHDEAKLRPKFSRTQKA